MLVNKDFLTGSLGCVGWLSSILLTLSLVSVTNENQFLVHIDSQVKCLLSLRSLI